MYTYSELKPRDPQLLMPGWCVFSDSLGLCVSRSQPPGVFAWIPMESGIQSCVNRPVVMPHTTTQHIPAGDFRLGSTSSYTEPGDTLRHRKSTHMWRCAHKHRRYHPCQASQTLAQLGTQSSLFLREQPTFVHAPEAQQLSAGYPQRGSHS